MGFLKKDISRRQFIGGALALAAASAVPSFIRRRLQANTV